MHTYTREDAAKIIENDLIKAAHAVRDYIRNGEPIDLALTHGLEPWIEIIKRLKIN